MAHSVLTRAVVGFLRLPGRTVPVPGWFPLVVEPVHKRLTLEPVQQVEIHGGPMRLDLGEYVQRRVFYHSHEVPEARWMAGFLRPGDRVLDIGANVGYFALLASHCVGSAGTVIALEPVPGNADLLTSNAALRGAQNIEVRRVAAGAESGTLSLGLPFAVDGTASGHYSEGGGIGAVEVDVVRPDELFAGEPPFRLVKIDVEGMEPKVLRGMDGLLADAPPEAILLELNPRALAEVGSSAKDIFDALEGHGYALHKIGLNGGTGARLSAEQFPPPSAASMAPDAGLARQLVRGLRGADTLVSVVALRGGA